MRCTLNGQVVVAQVHCGPLQAHINTFAQFLDAQGYSLISIRQQSLVVSDFNKWLHTRRIEQRDITKDHATRYLKENTRQEQPFFHCPSALDQLYRFLHNQKLILDEPVEVPVLCPIETCLLGYEHYLRKDRGLANGTIKNHLRPARCFLMSRFGSGPMNLMRWTLPKRHRNVPD